MQHLLPIPPDLQPWLQAAVVVDRPAYPAQSRFPAMVSSMLVVRLAGQVQCRGLPVPASAWISASTRATVYEHVGRVQAVGVVLQPEAAAALFERARGMVNTVLPLAELVGPGWSRYERQVLAAGEDTARLEGVFQLVRALAAPSSGAPARRLQALALLRAAVAADPGSGQRMGLGVRQFERRFVQHWGMAPKPFQVIARLNGALAHALDAKPGRHGADLAAEQGYYDQSHLARDVRRLAGEPLPTLVRGHGDPLSAHWPLQVGTQAPPMPSPAQADDSAPPERAR